MREITVVDQSTAVKSAEVERVLVALQVQVDRDFATNWGGLRAVLKKAQQPPDDGEAIYLVDDTSQASMLGYHDAQPGEKPRGFVFVRTCLEHGEAWSATLSHELLEQLADPYTNTAALVKSMNGWPVAVAYEVCDPVENDEYTIDGVAVSNFVHPEWFADPDSSPRLGNKVDFLGRLSGPLRMSPGGYLLYQRILGQWEAAHASQVPVHQREAQPHSRRQRRTDHQRAHFGCDPIVLIPELRHPDAGVTV